MATKSLLGFGNPLLDITAEVPLDFIESYGLKTNNQILGDESHLRLYDELLSKYSASKISGGSCLNTMRCVEWMLGKSRLTDFIGCVGDDEHGKSLLDASVEAGVKCHFRKDKLYPTGTCACLVYQGTRSLVANLNASSKYNKEDHYDTPEIQDIVNKSDIVYGTGFFLSSSPPTIIAISERCAKENKPFLFNLSSTFVPEFYFKEFSTVLYNSDYVVGNEDEAFALSKAMNWNETDLHTIVKLTSQLPKSNGSRSRTVIITHGKDPVIVYHNGQLKLYPIVVVPKVIDTNGAGDSFVGGFLSQLMNDRSIDECINAGLYASSICIQRSGVTYPDKCEYKK